jgi:poly-beta-1,6-N-acetyl-D-glucosamine N-deacetylase PgaB
MRALICLMLILIVASPAHAQPQGQRFVAIAFHDVVDDPAEVEPDSVTTRTLVQFFDWMKGSGWTAVSLDDLSAAAEGRRPLPDKAILLTFDDGYKSAYTRVFPLLKAYGYPAVIPLVGAWMEDTPGGTVLVGDERIPRATYISWAQAREMQASGLVEFASHTYDLHRGTQANPQGNQTPAAVTWEYDPSRGRYETDTEYLARIRADLERSIATIQKQLGRRPRAIAWPYGRYTGPAIKVAQDLGLSFGLTLEPEPAYTSNLQLIPRTSPPGRPELRDIVPNLRFEPPSAQTLRVACVSLDALAAAGDSAAQDAALGHVIEGIRALGANTVIIEAGAAPAPGQPLAVYFPSALAPMRQDLLSRAAWQIGTRGDADVFLHLPLAAATAAVGEANTPRLFAEMSRYARADGVLINLPDAVPSGDIVANQPQDIRARRAALDPAQMESWTALGVQAFRAAAAINPRIRLMVAPAQPAGPPDWADAGLLPPTADAVQTGALAGRLRSEGWLRPDVTGRVILSLPQAPGRQIAALREGQRQGATAFALCPTPPVLPPSKALAHAFSAASYPHKR